VDTVYANSLARIPDSLFKTEGIAAGNAAADAMIAARQNDGRFGPSLWVPNYDPGHWQPLLNPDGTQMLDPTPWVGGVRPFLRQSSLQFRTDVPRRSAGPRTRRTSTRSRRSAGEQSDPHARADEHPALLAEQSRRDVEPRSPETWPKIRTAPSTSPTAPCCSGC
jgi:hypothetical protein